MAIENGADDSSLPSSQEKTETHIPEAGFPPATIMAAFISLLGILALIAVVIRQ